MWMGVVASYFSGKVSITPKCMHKEERERPPLRSNSLRMVVAVVAVWDPVHIPTLIVRMTTNGAQNDPTLLTSATGLSSATLSDTAS